MSEDTVEIYYPGFPKPIIVDMDNYELVMRNKWFLVKDTNGKITAIASTSKTHIDHDNGCSRFIHRIINKTPEGIHTDHSNNNVFDNRRSNLRNCNIGQNRRNAGSLKQNSLLSGSKFKGVYQRFNKWEARISFNYKRIFIGSFCTEEEAARAYDAAAYKYHGNFAKYNYPMDDRC